MKGWELKGEGEEKGRKRGTVEVERGEVGGGER